jgi:hypothetical protein
MAIIGQITRTLSIMNMVHKTDQGCSVKDGIAAFVAGLEV